MTNEQKALKSHMEYSNQAMQLIKNLKENFDFENFEKWVATKLVVGGGHIIEFLQENPVKDTVAPALDEEKKQEIADSVDSVEILDEPF